MPDDVSDMSEEDYSAYCMKKKEAQRNCCKSKQTEKVVEIEDFPAKTCCGNKMVQSFSTNAGSYYSVNSKDSTDEETNQIVEKTCCKVTEQKKAEPLKDSTPKSCCGTKMEQSFSTKAESEISDDTKESCTLTSEQSNHKQSNYNRKCEKSMPKDVPMKWCRSSVEDAVFGWF